MSVSVIVPTYNCEKYLSEALDSIFKQKGEWVKEIIVVDDGSQDGTAEIAKSHKSGVRYCHQPNQGIGSARNRGVREAEGEFLAFLDADDLWHENKLEKQIEEMKKAQAEMAFTWVEHFHSSSASQKFTQSKEPMAGIFASTFMVKKEAFHRVGFFFEMKKVGEFIDWYSRAQHLNISSVTMPDVLAYRRIHDFNSSASMIGAFQNYGAVLKAHLDRKRKR